MRRGATAEIRLDAFSRNLGAVRRFSGVRPVIAVVKADAYGHGAAEVSRRLVRDGVEFLAVAFTEEAAELREEGISSPILVLFDKCDIGDFFRYDLIPVLHDLGTAKRFSEEAAKRNRPLEVHVEIDTGMGRLGLNSGDVIGELTAITKMDYLHVRGLMSHFSNSDIADTSCAESQLKAFVGIRDGLAGVSCGPVLCHMANSAASFSLGAAHLDAVRPGLALYGHSPFQGAGDVREDRAGEAELEPAMTVKTEVLSLRRLRGGTPVSYGGTFITRRESMMAVLPVGYADGYHRMLSNNMDVLVRGKRAPVAGRVCMDVTMVDVTDVGDVAEGDEVVLLGRQGGAEIGACEMAEKAGTIPYEILTSLGSRSRRVYV
ncbi:MAG: alanine racemase [Nitrospirae bacterium]|nr:alanine racemase [Nitrospirota bacterium]